MKENKNNHAKVKSNKEQDIENIDKDKDKDTNYEYNNYKDLTFQEIENYKHKYDNRLYASYRFKLWDNRIDAKDELFLKTRNTQIFAHGKVIKIKIKIN